MILVGRQDSCGSHHAAATDQPTHTHSHTSTGMPTSSAYRSNLISPEGLLQISPRLEVASQTMTTVTTVPWIFPLTCVESHDQCKSGTQTNRKHPQCDTAHRQSARQRHHSRTQTKQQASKDLVQTHIGRFLRLLASCVARADAAAAAATRADRAPGS